MTDLIKIGKLHETMRSINLFITPSRSDQGCLYYMRQQPCPPFFTHLLSPRTTGRRVPGRVGPRADQPRVPSHLRQRLRPRGRRRQGTVFLIGF